MCPMKSSVGAQHAASQLARAFEATQFLFCVSFFFISHFLFPLSEPFQFPPFSVPLWQSALFLFFHSVPDRPPLAVRHARPYASYDASRKLPIVPRYRLEARRPP